LLSISRVNPDTGAFQSLSVAGNSGRSPPDFWKPYWARRCHVGMVHRGWARQPVEGQVRGLEYGGDEIRAPSIRAWPSTPSMRRRQGAGLLRA
jgi:hypothetical protein